MAYSGQRGRPNLANFIADLNTIPPTQDMATQETFGIEDDLAMFTNAQFFDFDADLHTTNFDFNPQSRGTDVRREDKNTEFDISGEFSVPNFNAFPQPPMYGPDGLSMVSQAMQHGQPIYPAPSNASSPANGVDGSVSGHKRKSDSTDDSQYGGFEDESRMAAEEDKRRRNTAASARFRVKKKQREQALEKSAKDMSDKVSALENRINQLQTENKWLKNLIVEKNDNKEDIAALWKKHREESVERKTSDPRRGVGTKEDKLEKA